MADIAFIFHWLPEAMDQMAIDDLARWHHRALDRYNRANTPRENP